MNIDRRLFLALTTALATASTMACSASDAATASDSQDLQEECGASAEGSAACFDEGETVYPYAEGTCSDIAARAVEQCKAYYSAPSAEGGTPLTGEELEEVCNPEFEYGQCMTYATTYKAAFARDAITCLQKAPNVDSRTVYNCGFDALDKACGWHPAAEGSCRTIEAALRARDLSFDDAERYLCMIRLSGVNSAGRRQIENAAKNGSWYGVHSAIEGLEPAWTTSE